MSFKNEEFVELVYLSSAGDAANSGKSAQDPKPFSSAAGVMQMEAGSVVQSAELVVSEAVVGVTNFELGDSGDPDGLIANADVTLGTAGAYVGAGAELSKYFAADGSLDLAVTGTASAGAAVVMVKGYRV